MNAIPRPLLQALALVAGIGLLVLGTFCACEIWILKIWDSVSGTVPVTVPYKGNGGTLPTSHNY